MIERLRRCVSQRLSTADLEHNIGVRNVPKPLKVDDTHFNAEFAQSRYTRQGLSRFNTVCNNLQSFANISKVCAVVVRALKPTFAMALNTTLSDRAVSEAAVYGHYFRHQTIAHCQAFFDHSTIEGVCRRPTQHTCKKLRAGRCPGLGAQGWRPLQITETLSLNVLHKLLELRPLASCEYAARWSYRALKQQGNLLTDSCCRCSTISDTIRQLNLGLTSSHTCRERTWRSMRFGQRRDTSPLAQI